MEAGCNVPFQNHADYCVGTGRMGLALQKEYQEQLKLVQDHIGFKHIRGHGLFSDDMAIYHEYSDENGKTHAEYNFTYLDMVMDAYQDQGIKPFLELGFMPAQMASGTQTVFYWKGNVTPPKDYEAWKELVKATLGHLMRGTVRMRWSPGRWRCGMSRTFPYSGRTATGRSTFACSGRRFLR